MASFSPISLARQMCGPSSETALTISAGCPTRSRGCLRGMKSGGPRCWACSAVRSPTVYCHRVTYLTAAGGTDTDLTYQTATSRPGAPLAPGLGALDLGFLRRAVRFPIG